MNKLIARIREEVPWCMLFMDKFILVDETRKGIKSKLERQKEFLVSKGFRISRTKMEYMV